VDSWLERYEAGDHVQVWTEITTAGLRLRGSEEWDEAVRVARETMRRARANVERLIQRLPQLGYEFEAPERVFQPAARDAASGVDELEAKIGTLPLSLRFWYEQVGSVNLVGTHPEWDYDYTDPLVVEAPIDYILTEYEDWEADQGSEWDTGAPFRVDIAPDFLHKADVSGGGPYAIEVPSELVDAPLLEEFHQTTFVNYLRISFRWGGFPGWERPDPKWARPPGPPPTMLGELAAELLPI
jgi:hypothetical protein